MHHIEVDLCIDCLDAAADYGYHDIPGTMLPGIAGGDITIIDLSHEPDPHFSNHGYTCSGDSEGCLKLRDRKSTRLNSSH